MNNMFISAQFLRNSQSGNKLNSSERNVLQMLSSRIGNNADTWASQKLLAKDCGLKERQLRNILNSLCSKNIIQKTKFGRRNRYSAFQSDLTGLVQKRANTGNPLPVYTGTRLPVLICTTPSAARVVDASKPVIPTAKVQSKVHKDQKQQLPAPHEVVVVYPDWLNLETWSLFLQHRREIKKPLTRPGEIAFIKTLRELRESGQDVEKVINNSIKNNYAGLFAIKEEKKIEKSAQTYSNAFEKLNSGSIDSGRYIDYSLYGGYTKYMEMTESERTARKNADAKRKEDARNIRRDQSGGEHLHSIEEFVLQGRGMGEDSRASSEEIYRREEHHEEMLSTSEYHRSFNIASTILPRGFS